MLPAVKIGVGHLWSIEDYGVPKRSSPPRKAGSSSRSSNSGKRRFGISRATWIWVGLAVFLVAAVVCIVYGVWASTFDLNQVDNIPERSAVFDMDGKFYARLAGENRTTVHLDQVSDNFTKALLAREDSRFFSHHGVDPIGIARAMVRNILHGHISEGGSTLTQQLALNTFLGGQHTRSINRKLLEAFLALRIEQNFSKKQIIEAYMNRIYFGAGVYGIETASQAYYHKHAKDLSLTQAAMLVALIRSPSRYSPFHKLKRALYQRDEVLDRLVDLKMITQAAVATRRSMMCLAWPKNRPARRRITPWTPSGARSIPCSIATRWTRAGSGFTRPSTRRCRAWGRRPWTSSFARSR